MTCNYFEYRDMTEKLFFGTLLTQEHWNRAIEEIRQYIVNGGAGDVMKSLGIGVKVITEETLLLKRKIVKRCFVYIDGENKGRELDRHEITNIGMFLKHGALYGKCGCPAC